MADVGPDLATGRRGFEQWVRSRPTASASCSGRTWSRQPYWGTVLFIQLVPPMTLVPALFVTLVQFGLMETLAGLVMIHVVFHLPFATLLLKAYFDSVPVEMREAALVDGASELKAFRRIMLPVITPGLAAATILTAILSWNEFLLGLTLTRGPDAAPLTVAIGVLLQEYNVRYGDDRRRDDRRDPGHPPHDRGLPLHRGRPDRRVGEGVMGRQMRLGMVGTDIVHASPWVKAPDVRPSDAPALVEREHPNAPSATFQREVNV